MMELGLILWALLRVYTIVLIIRIIVEMIQSFSRRFSPPRWFVLIAEPMFVVTDPPVKALRRIIPPVQLGGVGLDLSVLVLFFILQVLQVLVGVAFRA
ncbi:MAG: YggT family protein [Corynebacterium sp.]|nr:YggT family protein [Corynebacterium sp.]